MTKETVDENMQHERKGANTDEVHGHKRGANSPSSEGGVRKQDTTFANGIA
jgi:hypothetical protein